MRRLGIAICLLSLWAAPVLASDNNPDPPDDTFTCPEGTIEIEGNECLQLEDEDCPGGWVDTGVTCLCESGQTTEDGECVDGPEDDTEPGDETDPLNCPAGHHQAGDWCVVDCPPGTVEGEQGHCYTSYDDLCGACEYFDSYTGLCIPVEYTCPSPPYDPPFPIAEAFCVVLGQPISTCFPDGIPPTRLVVINSDSVAVWSPDGLEYYETYDWDECWRGELPDGGTCIELCEADVNVPCRGYDVPFIWNPTE